VGLTIEAAPAVRTERNEARGSLRTNSTVEAIDDLDGLHVAEEVVGERILAELVEGMLGLIWRSIESFTASALSGVPSWKLMPLRSLKV
jgi:hypothetical protein